mmetsp:Transcript_37777/g.85880  ORF Transcript_37777/g.85880 Transcript_37777/m.85880 type:complete len:201 (+) Transcript_37777:226-828(+)
MKPTTLRLGRRRSMSRRTGMQMRRRKNRAVRTRHQQRVAAPVMKLRRRSRRSRMSRSRRRPRSPARLPMRPRMSPRTRLRTRRLAPPSLLQLMPRQHPRRQSSPLLPGVQSEKAPRAAVGRREPQPRSLTTRTPTAAVGKLCLLPAGPQRPALEPKGSATPVARARVARAARAAAIGAGRSPRRPSQQRWTKRLPRSRSA